MVYLVILIGVFHFFASVVRMYCKYGEQEIFKKICVPAFYACLIAFYFGLILSDSWWTIFFVWLVPAFLHLIFISLRKLYNINLNAAPERFFKFSKYCTIVCSVISIALLISIFREFNDLFLIEPSKFVWVIVVASVLFVLICLHRAFKIVENPNPIKTLQFNGTMGFRIGDSRDFVLSRILHLKLVESQQQLDEICEAAKKQARISMEISVANRKFNNVDCIKFIFSFGELEAIKIVLFPDQEDIDTIIRVTRKEINKSLACSAAYHPDCERYVWHNSYNETVVLNAVKDDPYVIIFGEEKHSVEDFLKIIEKNL